MDDLAVEVKQVRAPFDLRGKLSWQSWLLIIGLGLATYFCYHAINGSRGLLASKGLAAELQAAEHELESLQAERMVLAKRVERLRPGSLDPDLIDELARETLTMVEPQDVIILLDDGEALR